MPASPTIAEAVAALRAFTEALPQQPGLRVQLSETGAPASPEAIAHLRANPGLLPPDLIDLYELMNGCDVRWKFRDADQPARPASDEDADEEEWEDDEEWDEEDGSFSIPMLSARIHLRTDLENQYSFFGPGTRSVCFEQPAPEYGTWLVAYGPGGPGPEARRSRYHPQDYTRQQGAGYDDRAASARADVANARLLFQVYKDEYLPLPGTVADYLMQAVTHGCVRQWPLAWQSESPDMDRLADEWEDSVSRQVERFRAVTGTL